MYHTIYSHLEQYEVNAKRNLSGIDSKTGKVFPDWIRVAAAIVKEKMDKYYSTSDGARYIIGTGNPLFCCNYDQKCIVCMITFSFGSEVQIGSF